MKLHPNVCLSLQNRICMTYALSQSIAILAMTHIELSQFLHEQIEKNPLLKLQPFKNFLPLEFEPIEQMSAFFQIKSQIYEQFLEKEERKIALLLLNELDENGFLTTPLDVLSSKLQVSNKQLLPIIEQLKTLNPIGLFANGMQESFLMQMKDQNNSFTDAYKIIEDHFHDFLRGNFTKIKKIISDENLKKALKILSKLTKSPLKTLEIQANIPIIADVSIFFDNSGIQIKILDDLLPILELTDEYNDLNPSSKEEKKTMKEFYSQIIWLQKSINRRNQILLDILEVFIKENPHFFQMKQTLKPITTKELANRLNVHESTISRAIQGKYAQTPFGKMSFKQFITSFDKIKILEKLKTLIKNEDKNSPLSDDDLQKKLEDEHEAIARRTISKYRSALKIPPASKRKYLQDFSK